MNFPPIPLIDVFGYLSEINVGLSIAVVICAAFVSFLALVFSAVSGYNKSYARVGVWGLVIAIVITVVGVAYPLILVTLIIGLYLLIYWVIWRILIKNVIAVFGHNKPKK